MRKITITVDEGSLSARRAWIEICYLDNIEITQAVALRKESVDRNSVQPRKTEVPGVALRKESVDRNTTQQTGQRQNTVALRKESVDRNLDAMQIVIIVVGRSPQGERG